MEKLSLTPTKWAVLLLIPIVFWGFYWYVGFNQTVVKYLLFFLAVTLLLLNLKRLNVSLSKKNSYDKYVSIISCLIILSFFITYIYWGQNPILTYRAAASQFLVLYYFILKEYKVSYDELFRLVTIFAVIHIVLWMIALAAAPIVLFGNEEEISDSRGFYRIVHLKGLDTLCLFYFMVLCQKAERQWKKVLLIACAFICFVLVFLSLSRTLIASISIVTILYLLKKNKKALIVFVVVLGLGGYSTIKNNEIVSSLELMTLNQIKEKNEADLRMVEYTQFTKLYPFHILTSIFGNGEPHIASSYGIREEQLKDSIGFNRSDAGYIHIYVSYGLVMLLVFLLLLIKVVKQKVDEKYIAFKLFIYMLFLANIFSSLMFSYATAFMISLYALESERISSLENNFLRKKLDNLGGGE